MAEGLSTHTFNTHIYNIIHIVCVCLCVFLDFKDITGLLQELDLSV